MEVCVGDAVELLIELRDSIALDERTDKAVCIACNILDEIPYRWNEQKAKEVLKIIRKWIELNGGTQELP